jgi:TRADD-N domain-containing protein
MSAIGDDTEKDLYIQSMRERLDHLHVALEEARRSNEAEIYHAIRDAIERISKAKPSDVQEIAGSQIRLLLSYYQLVLDQAKKSFRWALVAAGIGLAFFILAVGFILYWNAGNAATVSVVSGAIVEAISAINFYLYSKTSGYLADFHNRLEGTQRYLLANSICESLDGPNKQTARIELVRAIAQINLPDSPPRAFAVAEKV